MILNKIGYAKPPTARGQEILNKLKSQYDLIDIDENKDVDALIVIGGDGTLLHNIHHWMHLNIPFYGINAGNVR